MKIEIYRDKFDIQTIECVSASFGSSHNYLSYKISENSGCITISIENALITIVEDKNGN